VFKTDELAYRILYFHRLTVTGKNATRSVAGMRLSCTGMVWYTRV